VNLLDPHQSSDTSGLSPAGDSFRIAGPGTSGANRRRTTRRIVQVGAACAAAVAVVGAILIVRDDSSDKGSQGPVVVDTSTEQVAAAQPADADPSLPTTPISAAPAATQSTTAPSTSPKASLPAPTTAPATTVAPAAPTTEVTPETTAPVATPSVTDVVVDFNADAAALQPAAVATIASGFVGVTADGRLFVAGSDSVVFLDATSGAETARFAWAANSTRTVFGIGPDDVLYVNEQPDDQPSTLIAYAPAGDQYVEVARTAHVWGDVNPELDETGVALIDITGAPSHFDYVDATGTATAKTLALPAVSFNESPLDVCDFTTAAGQWRVTVTFPPTHFADETFYACQDLEIGTDDVAVLTTADYQTEGETDTRITIVSGAGITYRSNGWRYAGNGGSHLYFTHDNGDGTLAIGTIAA